MNVSKYTEIYNLESQCIANDIDINEFKMPPMYSEKLFNNLIYKQLNVINTLPVYLNKLLIVGDIHGSIFQLFAPLISAGLIKNIKYLKEIDKFEFEYPKNVLNNSRVIYTGDILYRGIHAHIMAMIEALIEIVEHYNFKNVVWVFGNHDIEFIRYGGIPNYTLQEYKFVNKRFDEIHMRFRNFALHNPYPFCYYSKNNANNNFIVSHTIQTFEDLSLFVEYYSKLDKNVNIKTINANELNKYMNNIIKFMFKDFNFKNYSVQYDKKSLYHLCISCLYWSRPRDNEEYFTFNSFHHFIGHTPVEICGYEKIILNLEKPHVIIMCDYNTYNNEFNDNYTFIDYSINDISIYTKFNDLIKIKKHRIEYHTNLKDVMASINFIKHTLSHHLNI